MPYGLYDLDKYEKFKVELYKILKGSDFDAEQYVHETDESILRLVKELKEENIYLKNKVKELEQRLDQLEKEKNKEIYELKVQLGDKKSEWKIRNNSASRWNPDNLKFEPCILPIDFDINKMDITSVDEIGGKMWYDYPKNVEKTKQSQHWIYTELFDFLSNRKKLENIDIHNLQSEEDITTYYLSKGGKLRGKYPEKVIKFLYKTRGEYFYIHDFDKYCGFKDNRESRRQHINKLVKMKFIKPTSNQNKYQNLI